MKTWPGDQHMRSLSTGLLTLLISPMLATACEPRVEPPWPDAQLVGSSLPSGFPALPAISPDGRKVAVYQRGNGVNQYGVVYILDLSQDKSVRLSNDVMPYTVHDVSWLSDSRQLVMDIDQKLALADADTGEFSYIQTPSASFTPVSGPGQNQITGYALVPASEYRKDNYIDILDRSARTYTHFVKIDWSEPTYYHGMEWSPDGQLLAVSAYGYQGSKTGSDILLFDTKGDYVRTLVASDWDEWRPHWSPGGNWVVYVAAKLIDLETELVFVSLESQCIVREKVSGHLLTDVDSGPDGNLVVVYGQGLYTVDMRETFGYSVDELTAHCEPK